MLKHRFIRAAKKPQYLTELIERHEAWKTQVDKKEDAATLGRSNDPRYGPAEGDLWDCESQWTISLRARFLTTSLPLLSVGTIRNAPPAHQLHPGQATMSRSGTAPPPAPPVANNPYAHYQPQRAAPAPPPQINTNRLPNSASNSALTAPGSAFVVGQEPKPRGSKGPLPRPPSTQSLKPDQNQPHSHPQPAGGLKPGNEIFGTIRHASYGRSGGGAAAHHSNAASSPQQQSNGVVTGRATESMGQLNLEDDPQADDDDETELAMDDAMLDSVVIPALDAVSYVTLTRFWLLTLTIKLRSLLLCSSTAISPCTKQRS